MYDIFKEHLNSSDSQFDFKKNVGCRDAKLGARLAINYLTDKESTVVICALDISKAFDRVDFYCLFFKLMNRQAPHVFIDLLVCWFTKLFYLCSLERQFVGSASG